MPGKHHDLVNMTKKYKAELHEFFLDMSEWRLFKTRFRLDWKKERFNQSRLASIPQHRGIYAFTLEMAEAKLPPHGYILYVGITGDTSNSNLRTRYGQYLQNLRSENGRPAIVYMLKNWPRDLFFNFVALPNTNVDLARLERAFINCIMPPVNKRDIEAKLSAAVRARF